MRFFEHASAGETLMNALTVLTITFIVLIMLFFIMNLFSLVLGSLAQKPAPKEDAAVSLEPVLPVVQDDNVFAAGTLTLKDIDEATAAMVMAIVSDKSGISLERLIFRSIKLIKEGE